MTYFHKEYDEGIKGIICNIRVIEVAGIFCAFCGSFGYLFQRTSTLRPEETQFAFEKQRKVFVRYLTPAVFEVSF